MHKNIEADTPKIGGLFTVVETCRYLRCSRSKLLYLRKAGKIENIISGKQVLFTGKAIIEFLANNTKSVNNG